MKIRKGYIEITNKIIEKLIFHHNRTGVGPQKLLRGKRGNLPLGLSSGVIYNWINNKSKTAKREHLDFVLKEWKALKDNPNTVDRNKNYKEGLETISHNHLMRLKNIKELTGILPSKLFDHFENSPKYLTPNIISNWIHIDGYKARKEDVDWVLEHCDILLKEALENSNKEN
ncbi:MAG: hypothetical protein KDC67_08645 [Ignavibacteriae bacterium]|nr:hypothetical protein [Ignavibacteriota bacterium]